MKRYLLLALLSISIVGYGKTIERTETQNREGIVYEINQSKPFTGKVVEKYPNGELAVETTFKNGQPDGIMRLWYENGQLQSEGTVKNEQPEGITRMWYENGQLQFEGTFKNGQLDGITRMWYENGQLKGEGTFKNGQPDGLQRMWYENGHLQGEGTYKNGKEEGVQKEWYENGQLQSEETYKNGKIIGIKVYDGIGELRYKKENKNGINGLIESFYENGILKSEIVLKNGIPEGVSKFYNPNGSLSQEMYYKNGRLNGMKVYYENGDLYKEVIYEDGALVNIIEYYENGRIKFIDDGHESSYYEDEPINFKELTRDINKLEKEVTEHKKTGEVDDGFDFGWKIAGMRQFLEGLSLSKNLSSEEKIKLKKLENQLDDTHKQAQKIWGNE